MVLRIRLSRFGSRHSPIYNIVLAQAKSARDSKPLEVLGTYDPKPKTPLAKHNTPEFEVNEDGSVRLDERGEKAPFREKRYKDIRVDRARVRYWLGVGAQASDGVEKLLSMVRMNLGSRGVGEIWANVLVM